jgi:hypothetical protein
MKVKARTGIAAALLLLAGAARGEEPALAPPAGAQLLLSAAADGVQIYACEAAGAGFAWVFKAPEAALFDAGGRQIGTHFAGPTWRSGDGSAVVGEAIGKADAPGGGAIPWLLLRAKTHQGEGALTAVAFIARRDTTGGLAPQGGCDAAHRGAEARMRYSAAYLFYAAP